MCVEFILVMLQIKCCDKCQRMQRLQKSATTELHPIRVEPEVWSLVGMDLVGPLTKTKRGNQYILTMTCYFSKWVEAVALPNKSALCVAQAIFKVYCRHGAPQSIITDQGKEFINQVLIFKCSIFAMCNSLTII